MEESTAPWTKVVETSCKIQGFGKPVGTVKETLLETADSWEVTFSIDEEMTQTMVDGYAQAVWRACEMRSGEANRSGSGSRYDSMEEAEKRQEPLNYYIWYYRAGEETFRLGLYPTNMETGVPGGLVLRIERWA